MYNNDHNAGIERNVKTGSKTALIVTIVIVVLLFILPQLGSQQIEEWIGGFVVENSRSDKTSHNFLDVDKQIQQNLKIQEEKRKEIAQKKAEKRQKATQVSKRLPLLMLAVEANNLYLVKYLIEHGTKPDIQDIDGNEALSYVTERTSPEVIAYLLDQGLDINHRNKFQNTPLMFAIRHENVPAVQFMVEHGADVRAITRSGRTMVSMAQGPKVRAYLMSLNKPVPTALTRIWWRQASLADVKRAFHQNPKVFKDRQIFALAAANTPDTQVIQFLIDKGLDVNQVDETGITPIFSAASSNANPAILRYLVEHGADVNRMDEIYDTTPLMAAAYFQRNPEIFKTLLDLGANPTLKDRSGQTAIDYAERSNSREVISLLNEAAATFGR